MTAFGRQGEQLDHPRLSLLRPARLGEQQGEVELGGGVALRRGSLKVNRAAAANTNPGAPISMKVTRQP